MGTSALKYSAAVLGIVALCTALATASDESIFQLGPRRYPDFDALTAEPGLTYGSTHELPMPKTILFSASPDEIIADAEEWSRRGINAFFLDYVAREWSSDIWARNGKAWTIGDSDETFRKAKEANAVCRRLGSETFLKVAFDNCFEWFNDIAWQKIYSNFRQFAIFARETGCTGIALDIEYCGEQYHFEWEGYTYDGYTRKDLVEKIQDRMTGVIRTLYDEFPDMVFLTFPEGGLGFGTLIHVSWVEEAARRKAPGGVHYCTEYTYRRPNIRYMFAHAWQCNRLFQALLSRRANPYWREKCSISAGVWPFGFDHDPGHSPGMPSAQFHQAYAASLMLSSRYNWIYSHNCREQLIGRHLDEYTGEEPAGVYHTIMADKDTVTTPKYVALAKELRQMALRDFSQELGLRPAYHFIGPHDQVVWSLMPAELYENSPHFELRKNLWEMGLERFRGHELNYRERFATQTGWMLIGPFPNDEDYTGYDALYPPETVIDLNGVYEGVEGKVRWVEHQPDGETASVNLAAVFEPTERVCAYALCYVTAPKAMDVQIRLGTNDLCKLWLDDQLVFENPQEGRIVLDKNTLPVTLPNGTTRILLKVCQGEKDWGFVFRITDKTGEPINELKYRPRPR